MEQEDKKKKLTKEELKEKILGKKLTKKQAIIIAIFSCIFVVLIAISTTGYQSTDDAYIESHIVQIAPKVGGQVVEVLITDNQKVKEGDIVAKIDDTDYKVRFNQADAQYERALLAQNVAKANLGAVNSEIELAKKDLERYKNLYKTGAVSKQALDMAQTKYDGIVAKHTSAEQQIFSTTDSKVADADLKALKALREQARLHLEYTTVLAPRTGTVTNKKVEKGAFVQAGQPLFAIVPDEVWVVANFKESQVGKMYPGQAVKLKIDAYPKKVFKGKIDSIQQASGAKSSLFPPENAVGSFVKIVQRVPVKIVFDEPIDKEHYNIVAGMSVVPKVKVK